MNLQVVVGNYRGLTEDVQVFLDSPEACNEFVTAMKDRYGIPKDAVIEVGAESTVGVYDFELGINVSLLNLRLVLGENEKTCIFRQEQ